jgi:hypothetical protein
MEVLLYPSINGKNQLNYGTFRLLYINSIQYKFKTYVYSFLPPTHNIDLCQWNYCYHPNDVNCPDFVSCLFVFVLRVFLFFFN